MSAVGFDEIMTQQVSHSTSVDEMSLNRLQTIVSPSSLRTDHSGKEKKEEEEVPQTMKLTSLDKKDDS